ncbi:MAG: hypothetical protein VX265_17690 [Myxococcota bacterium]|nr:hypothetical protein [Myxococcota bacterium]MEC8423696.1 hypothetical protein [Myxococcota bacterium]
MALFRLGPAVVVLPACSPGGVHRGMLADGLTGEPHADVQVVARPLDAADRSCAVREARTDAAGVFALEGACVGVTYALSLAEGDLRMGGGPGFVADEPTTAAPRVYTAWRVPAEGTGVYKLSGDALRRLETFADVHTETVLETDTTVRYPTLKPVKVPSLGAGDWLVIVGRSAVERLKLHPLIADGAARSFKGDVRIDRHVYIGVRFRSDRAYEFVQVRPEPSRTRRVSAGERVVRYVAQDAVPEGRYALLGDSDARTYVVDFGAPGTEDGGQAR